MSKWVENTDGVRIISSEFRKQSLVTDWVMAFDPVWDIG